VTFKQCAGVDFAQKDPSMRFGDRDPDLICVQQYQRKPVDNQFSMERVFEAIRSALPPDISVEAHTCPFRSRGLFKRIINIVDASIHQREINHIVGDVSYLALGLRKQNTIVTIHDCVGLHMNKGLKRMFLLWFWYLFPVKRAGAVTVISSFTRDEVLQFSGCDPTIVHVIPNPIPIGFVPFPKTFNAKIPVVLQVGTAVHNKNIHRVAEALRGIPCHLDIIGKLNEDQRRTLETNQINYTAQSGLSDVQMIEKYRQCDIVLFASTYEGFGMPIIEANATGRVVVTSRVGPMPEVAGPAACLVDPYDWTSIRAGIVRVIEDASYRDELIARGYENALLFGPEIIAQRYADLYRKVCTRV
jgi:glycosyltransferase involved in cell wall biosynthesis